MFGGSSRIWILRSFWGSKGQKCKTPNFCDFFGDLWKFIWTQLIFWQPSLNPRRRSSNIVCSCFLFPDPAISKLVGRKKPGKRRRSGRMWASSLFLLREFRQERRRRWIKGTLFLLLPWSDKVALATTSSSLDRSSSEANPWGAKEGGRKEVDRGVASATTWIAKRENNTKDQKEEGSESRCGIRQGLKYFGSRVLVGFQSILWGNVGFLDIEFWCKTLPLFLPIPFQTQESKENHSCFSLLLQQLTQNKLCRLLTGPRTYKSGLWRATFANKRRGIKAAGTVGHKHHVRYTV